MNVLVICKFKEDPIKQIGQHFPVMSMAKHFCHSRASNSKVNIPVWPKFELRRDFMPVLVTCKFDEDPIKIEGTIDWSRSNMGFFVTQGQATPIWPEFELI